MTREKGAFYEREALRYLQREGLSLLEKNYHTRGGEIDLIMRDGDCLTFVEVRYRRRNRFSTACESIGNQKQSKIICAAEVYLSKQLHFANDTVRFDVVAFDSRENSPDRIQWLQDAFRA